MSTKTNTGGQAFPCLERDGDGLALTDGGMILRDYFAAKAMQALVTAGLTTMAKHFSGDTDSVNPIFAKSAYELADAMIKERNNK